MTKTISVVLKGEQSSPIQEQLFKLFNTSGSQKAVAEEIISVYCFDIGMLSTNLSYSAKIRSFRIVEVNSMVDLRKGYPESVTEIVFEIKENDDANQDN